MCRKKTSMIFLPVAMYQGTIWQYRWIVPFDVKGLIEECGGEETYIKQLDTFFGSDLYNASNEPDIQVPYMYSGNDSAMEIAGYNSQICTRYGYPILLQRQ